MSGEGIPQFRSYRHSRCDQETVVSGQSFEVVSNPMSSMDRTFCSSCGAMFPIGEFAWADTKETISDYYSRHGSRATALERFLCSKTLMVALILVSAVTTSAGMYFLFGNDKLAVRILMTLFGVMVGAFVGMAIFLSAFANPIKRRVCGVNDTRRLR